MCNELSKEKYIFTFLRLCVFVADIAALPQQYKQLDYNVVQTTSKAFYKKYTFQIFNRVIRKVKNK